MYGDHDDALSDAQDECFRQWGFVPYDNEPEEDDETGLVTILVAGVRIDLYDAKRSLRELPLEAAKQSPEFADMTYPEWLAHLDAAGCPVSHLMDRPK